uniref:PBPe domain-containing protein n=1 Tax=Macrostomum lignano TaxID=282301 RepID=A0A1I8FU98_9PLAT
MLGLLSNPDAVAELVPSGRFIVENGSLVVTFEYKERELLFPNTFVDFKGARLRVCAPPFPPFTRYSNYTFGTASGHSVDMVNYYASHLNFSYDIFSPPDIQFGAPVEGSPYFSGCIGMLQRGEAEFAMPFAITNIRYQVIDYSEDYMFSANTILVKRPPSESKLWNVFTPLAWDSWLLILGMLVFVPIIVFVLASCNPFSGWNLRISYAFADEVWLKEYIWSVIGSFLQQGQDFYPFAMSPRTVLAFWWMLTVILYGAYTGDLTAKLAVTVAEYPIQSLEDLVSMPHYKAMVARGTNIYATIMLATDGPMALLRRQMVVVDTMTTCAETLLIKDADPYMVCISDKSSNSFYASAFCSQVYQATSLFNYYYQAMTFPRDAYYLPAFDLLLQRGKESGGVVDVVTRKYVPQSNDCGGSNAAAQAAAISLEGVGGAYIICLGLYVCGGLVLLVELLWLASNFVRLEVAHRGAPEIGAQRDRHEELLSTDGVRPAHSKPLRSAVPELEAAQVSGQRFAGKCGRPWHQPLPAARRSKEIRSSRLGSADDTPQDGDKSSPQDRMTIPSPAAAQIPEATPGCPRGGRPPGRGELLVDAGGPGRKFVRSLGVVLANELLLLGEQQLLLGLSNKADDGEGQREEAGEVGEAGAGVGEAEPVVVRPRHPPPVEAVQAHEDDLDEDGAAGQQVHGAAQLELLEIGRQLLDAPLGDVAVAGEAADDHCGDDEEDEGEDGQHLHSVEPGGVQPAADVVVLG